MNEQKSLLTYLVEALDQYRAARRRPAQEQASPKRLGRLRAWLPSRGNVLFTLLVVAGLLWANSVGALPLRAPAAAGTSTGTIAYQGRLADADGTPITDTVNMEFRLYDVASGGIFLWEELWTGSNSVQVSDGLFNVMLGSLTSIPQSVITGHDSLFLGITVGTDDEMEPRVQLGSVPFAVQALTVPDGSVTTEKIADEAVTQAKLGADVSLEPPDGSITTAKLADDAVTSAKIAHTFGASNKEMLNFVLNSDPTSWVYSSEAAPQDIWTTLDLSSVVSSKAVAVAIFAQLWTGTGDQSHVKFRQKGEGSDYDAPLIAFSTGVNNTGGGFTIVECDSSQNIEFYIQGGTAHLRIQVIGWWEPAHQ